MSDLRPIWCWPLLWLSRRRVVRRVKESFREWKKDLYLGQHSYSHPNRTHVEESTDCTKTRHWTAICQVGGCGWRGGMRTERELALVEGAFHSGREHWFR